MRLKPYIQNHILNLFLSLSFLLHACSPAMRPTSSISMPERGLCAHRGAMDTHPENTIPAFLEAIRLGAHMIEFDLQLTKDSVLVIMHDETVDRTTNGHGKIANLTLVDIQALDAGIKKSDRFAGVHVPTFEETLAIMPRNIWLNCHLKGGAEAGQLSAQILVKTGRTNHAFLACGEDAAKAARDVNSRVQICNMEDKYRKNPQSYVKSTIRMKAQFLQLVRNGEPEEKLMKELSQNNVRVNYFYAKEPDELARLFNSGVNFVLVNELSRFMAEAQKLNIKPWKPKF